MSKKPQPAKSKLKMRFKLSNEDKDLVKSACSTAADGLNTILQIANDVAGNAGVPGLQIGISGLLAVLDIIKKSSQNAGDVARLTQHITDLKDTLEKSKDKGAFSPTVVTQIQELANSWTKSIEKMHEIATRSMIGRLVHQSSDTDAISNFLQDISQSIERFMLRSLATIESTTERIEKVVERVERQVSTFTEEKSKELQGTERIENNIKLILTRMHTKDVNPPHALLASFDRKDRALCLQGTRTDVLRQVQEWVAIHPQHSTMSAVQPDSILRKTLPVFWINGSAGTGKTTIAYTIAEQCRRQNILGASFFCSRDDADCSSPRLIFTTIAYQLGNFCPAFKEQIAITLKSNPDIGYSDVSYQLQKLVVEPLSEVGASFPSCVIVIDALDECKDDQATSTILNSLSQHITGLPQLKFLVTSRPERNITQVFKKNLKPTTEILVLHNLTVDVVKKDIVHYLQVRLAEIRDNWELEDVWPSMDDVEALAKMSAGLFIFAATSVKYIADQNSSPKEQMLTLLHSSIMDFDESSPQHRLDQLYTQVLTHAFPQIKPPLAHRLKMILGTIALLEDPLSVLGLERLILKSLEKGTVRQTLVQLHSVVIVPDDNGQVIRFIHPSFFDYITDPVRCINTNFVIKSKDQHSVLAEACLEVMRGLKKDMCNITNASLLNGEIDDLCGRARKYIPDFLQYACRHWATHLANAEHTESFNYVLEDFFTTSLLHWIEACSLIGDLQSALSSLDLAHKILLKQNDTSEKLVNLLYDCRRFVLEFFDIIGVSALQVYESALWFMPVETVLFKAYKQELANKIRVLNAVEEVWRPCMRTMEGHLGIIGCVSFSPDSSKVVSGSDDKTVRLWDAFSGAHLNTFTGHSMRVTSVAFSLDGTHLVSGSHDETVRLWDAVTGAHLSTFTGHSDKVTSVAFSPDATNVVSGSWDETLRLWDAVSGAHLNTFTGHSDKVTFVAFSPDSTHVISGSDDKTVRLWDVVSGAHLSTFTGHHRGVTSVAFSPDGAHIISGSGDKTIRLWDVTSGAHLNTFTGHSGWVASIAFSPNGKYVVSGSWDKTARLWDAVSGAHINTLTGNSGSVRTVSFSPDGKPVVAGSDDKTVRLWDAVSGAHLNTIARHSKQVKSIAFSPDGTQVISGSDDITVRLWDAVSGAHLNTFTGHHRGVTSVAFSPDGTHIISGSGDKTIRLWDAVSGAHLNTFTGHFDQVRSVAFSPDGTQIVSGSGDATIRLWDAVSGAHLNTFTGHSGWVASVAFSPNGTHVVSGSRDRTVRLWDAVSGAHLKTLTGHYDWVKTVVFSPDGTQILSRTDDETIKIWNAQTGALTCDLNPGVPSTSLSSHYKVTCALLNQTGLNVILQDGWIVFRATGRRLCWLPVVHRGVLSYAKNFIALGTMDGRVVILHLNSMDDAD